MQPDFTITRQEDSLDYGRQPTVSLRRIPKSKTDFFLNPVFTVVTKQMIASNTIGVFAQGSFSGHASRQKRLR